MVVEGPNKGPLKSRHRYWIAKSRDMRTKGSEIEKAETGMRTKVVTGRVPRALQHRVRIVCRRPCSSPSMALPPGPYQRPGLEQDGADDGLPMQNLPVGRHLSSVSLSHNSSSLLHLVQCVQCNRQRVRASSSVSEAVWVDYVGCRTNESPYPH